MNALKEGAGTALVLGVRGGSSSRVRSACPKWVTARYHPHGVPCPAAACGGIGDPRRPGRARQTATARGPARPSPPARLTQPATPAGPGNNAGLQPARRALSAAGLAASPRRPPPGPAPSGPAPAPRGKKPPARYANGGAAIGRHAEVPAPSLEYANERPSYWFARQRRLQTTFAWRWTALCCQPRQPAGGARAFVHVRVRAGWVGGRARAAEAAPPPPAGTCLPLGRAAGRNFQPGVR